MEWHKHLEETAHSQNHVDVILDYNINIFGGRNGMTLIQFCHYSLKNEAIMFIWYLIDVVMLNVKWEALTMAHICV